MVVFNYSSRELTTKIVYYGPGLCGKTTNLQFIYDNMPQGVRGKMLSLATKSDRTLFFDFLPIDLGQIQGMKTKVQLYTVPGQVFYNETRRLVLKGADGVVFVADSQENMLEANLDSLRNLEDNLQAHGMDPATTPIVLQYNKRDLPNAMPVERLNEALNRFNAPFYEAIATTGVGVQETLRHISKLVLLSLNDRYGSDRKRTANPVPQPATAAPAAPVVPSVPMAPPIPVVAPAPMPEVAAPRITAPPLLVTPARVSAPEPEIPGVPEAIPTSVFSPVAGLSASDGESAFGALVEDAKAEVAFSSPPDSPVRPARPQSPAVSHRAPASPQRPASPSSHDRSEEWGDVLGVAQSMPRPGAGTFEDEDVLGIGPSSAAVVAPTAEPAGTTLKLDRNDLQTMLEAETVRRVPASSGVEQVAASAVATLVEVAASDALFNEAEVEATRLIVGQPCEILVPVEIVVQGQTRRFRLAVRLELAP